MASQLVSCNSILILNKFHVWGHTYMCMHIYYGIYTCVYCILCVLCICQSCINCHVSKGRKVVEFMNLVIWIKLCGLKRCNIEFCGRIF